MSIFVTAPTGEEFYYPTPNTRIQKTKEGKYIATYKYYSRIIQSDTWVSACTQKWRPSNVYTLYNNVDEAISAALSASIAHQFNHRKLHLERCLLVI